MHSYASNDRKHKETVIYMVSVSTLISLGLHLFAAKLFPEAKLPFEIPGAMAVFGAVYWLFKKYVWRLTIASGIPNLKGSWVACFRTSHDGEATERFMYVHIQQNWNEILITTETDESRAKSTMASLDGPSSHFAGLRYEYENKPKNPKGELQPHAGTVHLQVEPGGKELRGEYYTGPSRYNRGAMVLHFVQADPMKFEEAIAKYKQHRKPVAALAAAHPAVVAPPASPDAAGDSDKKAS